jgi:hypothetical protein
MAAVAPLHSLRVLLVVAALAAPFAVAAQGASALVAPVSRAMAGVLVGALAPLSRAVEPASMAAEESDGTLVGDAAQAPVSLAVGNGSKAPARHGAGKPGPKGKPSALFVSQATVLKLAESAARPRGTFVPQTSQHPQGLRLSGVSALGIGVQDGDILIEALGITPRAPGELIGAIIQARAKNARSLSGTLWRQGDTFAITVEQPYLPAKG